jgi:hypothetical protein
MVNERILISMFEEPKMVERECIICGNKYSYKAYTNFYWKGTHDALGRGDVVSSKDPEDRRQIWPNDCCEDCRTLENAKKYMEDIS